MESFRVDRGVSTLNVIPTRFFIDVRLVVVTKININYVVRPECLFDGLRDGSLCFEF